jgi:plasmid replication initiation protein
MSRRMVNDKKEVIKHSAAVHIQNNITLLQRRSWNVLLANAYDELPTEEEHQIPVKDLIRMLDFDSKNEDYLKESLEALVGCKVKWNVLDKDGEEEWGVTTLLAQAKIRRGICTYAYSPELRRRLHNPRMYARINLGMQNKFESKHAQALWEVCVDYLDESKNYGETPFIPLNTYRELMGISEVQYVRFKDLSLYVVKAPVDEINRVTDFRVAVVYKRERRKVTGIKFKVQRVGETPMTAAMGTLPLFSNLDDMPMVVRELKSMGLSTADAWEIWQQGFEYVELGRRPADVDFETYIQEKIHLLKLQPEAKVKNKIGFLLNAIRKNYVNAEFEQARRVQKSRSQTQERKALEREKERLEREHEARWSALCLQVLQEVPAFVEEVAQNLGMDAPFLRTRYDSERTALENYHQSVFFAAHVNEKLKAQYPERFTALDQEYARKATEIDSKLVAL